MRIFGGFVGFRVIYIFLRDVVGILGETGPMFPHAQLYFAVFSTPLLGIFILHFVPRNVKSGQKSEAAFVGAGTTRQYTRAKSLFFWFLQSGGPRDRKDICCSPILILFGLIYGYRAHFRKR